MARAHFNMIAFNMIAAFFVLSVPLGLASGLAKSRFPRLPAIAVGPMLAAWLIALAYSLGWAADCWECSYGAGDEPLFGRSIVPLAAAIVGAAAVAITIVTAWFGSRLSDRRANERAR